MSRGADLNTYDCMSTTLKAHPQNLEQQPLETSAWNPAPDAAARGLNQDASSVQPPKPGNWQIPNTRQQGRQRPKFRETHVDQALQSISAFVRARDNPQNRHTYGVKIAQARSGTGRPSKDIARISV